MTDYIFVIVTLIFIIFNIYLLNKRQRLRKSRQRAVNGTQLRISTLVLLNDEMKPVREWSLRSRAGFLIGRMDSDVPDEINLSEAASAALIEKEHAILNYTNGRWYIEDLDTVNGTGVQKNGQGEIRWLAEQTPYEIECNDIIFIADTALLIN